LKKNANSSCVFRRDWLKVKTIEGISPSKPNHKMKTTLKPASIYSAIRAAVAGERRSIQIGRSRNSSQAGTRTPIRVVAGGESPNLVGQPYLKTTFRNGSFQKTLYTPSTLAIEVGSGWIAANY
jgi:hypothetical protein